ncbi:MAG TPA: TonB family protein [Thermoanaerobaculia bacterium]|nr:TonB family protein [Thermoanaerobaculia bacterium]
MPLLQQQIEGKYEILEKIKEGGMGAVYKVRHRFLDEIRVIKVIRSSLEPSQELSDRFLREARLAIRLRHPSIAVLYDFAVGDDGNAFIVMEYIAGLTLEDVVRIGGPPPLGLALEVASQALRAIGYLHRQGFVHRDVAPDNLMLTRGVDGEPLVKLIDLGIAKVLAGEGAVTTTGIFLGKPRYASPEHFGVQELDQRSDLYSFGVVLYELLTGHCPVAGNDPASYMAGHLFRPPLDFAESDPQGRLPAELRRILLRALAKAPAERFASAADFARELAPLRERLPVQAGDLEAVLAPALDRTATWVPAPPAGSSQVRLDRQFLAAGATPQPEAPGASHLRADPRLVAPETLPPPPPEPAAPSPGPAPSPGVMAPRPSGPAPPPPASAPVYDPSLDETLPLTTRARMPMPPAVAPLATNWKTRSLHRTSLPSDANFTSGGAAELGFKRPGGTPASAAAREAGFGATKTGGLALPAGWAGSERPERPTRRALMTTLLLVAAGILGGGAWWYLHPREPAEQPGHRSGIAPASPSPSRAPGAPAPPGAPRELPRSDRSVAPGAAGPGASAPVPAPGDRRPDSALAARDKPPGEPRVQSAGPGWQKGAAPGRRAAVGGTPAPPAASSSSRGAGTAPAGGGEDTRPIAPGPGVEAAEPVNVPDAVYPAAARGTGKQAQVLLAVLVDESGHVIEVRVKQGDSSGLGFNEAAAAAARQARFLAATRNGVPVRSWSELMIDFSSSPNH